VETVRRRCPACGASVTADATTCDMCYAPIRLARATGWRRGIEIAAGLAIVLVLVGAVFAILRVRPDSATALDAAAGVSADAIGPAQLALGGTATIIPTLTATAPPTGTPPRPPDTPTTAPTVAQRS